MQLLQPVSTIQRPQGQGRFKQQQQQQPPPGGDVVMADAEVQPQKMQQQFGVPRLEQYDPDDDVEAAHQAARQQLLRTRAQKMEDGAGKGSPSGSTAVAAAAGDQQQQQQQQQMQVSESSSAVPHKVEQTQSQVQAAPKAAAAAVTQPEQAAQRDGPPQQLTASQIAELQQQFSKR